MKNKTIQEGKESIYTVKENTEYEQYSEEIRSILRKGAVVYIPELAEKLKKKYKNEAELTPDEIKKRNKEIHDRLLDDWGNDDPWDTHTVINVMPFWVKNERQSKATTQRNLERKVQKSRQELKKVFSSIQEPPKPKPRDEINDDSQIVRRLDDEPLFRKLGDTGKSVLEQYGKLFGPLQDLIEGLTHQRLIPLPDEDRINEYIKPSREEFMTIYHEVDQHMQVSLYNGFVYLNELLEDRIEQIDKVRLKK